MAITPEENRVHIQTQAALQEALKKEHRAGLHPYGQMRRECPFCQLEN